MFSQVIFIASSAYFASASVAPAVVVKAAPKPYSFGYNIKDKTSQQYRQESGNGAGLVKGSYGFADARGIQRQVNYVADDLGFRAQVNTNEPGTANQSPAAVEANSNAPNAGKVAITGLGVNKNFATVPKSVGVRYRAPLRRYRYGIGNGLGTYGLGNYFGNFGYGYDSDLVNFGYRLGSDIEYTLEYDFESNIENLEFFGYGNDLGSLIYENDLGILGYENCLGDLRFGYGYDFGDGFGYYPGAFGNIVF